MNSIRDRIDLLAIEVGHPVGLDDRRYRFLAYSPHRDHVDEVRLASILQRSPPPEVAEWLDSLGLADAETYAKVPPNSSLGMVGRVCVPVRFRDLVLGYIWLAETSGTLASQAIATSIECATELGPVLYQQRLLDDDVRERERSLLSDLLGAPEVRAPAVARLIDDGWMKSDGNFSVVVLLCSHPLDHALPERDRVALMATMESLRRSRADCRIAVLPESHSMAMILTSPKPGAGVEAGRDLLAAAGAALPQQHSWTPYIGVSEAHEQLEDLHHAYRQASWAAELASQIPGAERVVSWEELGSYRIIAELAGSARPALLGPSPAVGALLDSSEGEVLVDTLEQYLERAGDVNATANALFLHRSSVYQRLRRIEELTGADLHDGDHRLELHLAIKLLRLGSARTPRGVRAGAA